jgi:S1-C subfamily serine protease
MTEHQEPTSGWPQVQATPSGGAPVAPRRRKRGVRLWVASVAMVVALAAGLGLSWGLRPVAGRTAARVSSANTNLAAIEAKVDPAIVDIVSTLDYGTGEAAGTGIVLTSTGEVLTNNHVIDGATSIKVTDIGNGTTYTATVVGYDESADVAVLELQGASGLETASIASSGAAVGESVVALGNAGGVGGTPSAAAGTITGLDQSITAADGATGTAEQLSGLVESNADVQAGDSGGPLVNTSGQVIAMDTAASSGFQFQTSTGTQSYSIPIAEALQIARHIEAGAGSSTIHIGTTAFLGIEVAAGSEGGQPAGADVAGVVSGSPAADAGLSAGDVISALNGSLLNTADGLSSALVHYRPGDKVTVTWSDQSGGTHTATMVLATGPAA